MDAKELFEIHPLPWRVKYNPRRKDWDPKSLPAVVDSTGALVVQMESRVPHPGKYDPTADCIADLIVGRINDLLAWM